MSRTPSLPNGDGPTDADGGQHVSAPRVGLAAAGIACLTLIAGGTFLTGLFANGLTREFGIDLDLGLDDVIGTVVFNLPAFGLTALAVWCLRRAGLPLTAGWVCLVTAVLIASVSIAFTALAVAEFADTEGTGPVLVTRGSVVFVLVIAIILARVGVRFLRDRSQMRRR